MAYTRYSIMLSCVKTGACCRPEDRPTVNADAFDNLCEWLESSCEDRLYTLEYLQQHMSNYVVDKFGRLTDSMYVTFLLFYRRESDGIVLRGVLGARPLPTAG